MNIKTYKLPNGKKAVFEYDVCGIGKVTLECMDELMGMIAEAPTIDIVRCKECKYEDDCEQEVLLSDMYGEVEDTAHITYCSYGEREGE